MIIMQYALQLPLAIALTLVLAGIGAGAHADTPPASAAPPALARPDGEPELTREIMYRLLVGDIAMQRGDVVVAARAYFEAARDTGSVALARRATEIGLATRQRVIALEAARLWSRLDPDAERPRQLVTALSAANATRALEMAATGIPSREDLERALAEAAKSPEALADAFLEINRVLARNSDKVASFRVVEALARKYPEVPEAQLAIAHAGLITGLSDASIAAAATDAVERALVLRPGWDRAVILKAEIVGRKSPDTAIETLKAYLQQEPTSRPAAGALAQVYVEQKRYADARAVFEKLWAADKSNREVQYALAVLTLEMKDWTQAESLFEDLRKADFGETGAVEIYLAQIAEETGRYQLAFERYRDVPDSERAWFAKLRAAAMLGKLKRMDEARRFLADLPAVTLEQRVQVRQAEAQLLRDAGDMAGAYAVLERSLVEHPDDPDLLYDIAMVAEKLDRLDVVEANLRRLIELKPDSPHALNSLGYTLVDRTPRTAEGLALIERALKLSPNDGFILDSMGWALFRMGKFDDAESYLRQALKARPDAEIAAHLGEVLWAKGDRDRAREVWQSQLKANPDNAVLLDTMRRFAP
jgi:tetratricopeptide (TPR) repeat protein